MSTLADDAKAAAFSATLCAAAMIAHQVAAKAARDAFFLTAFEVTLLPRMTVVSAIVSVAVVLLSARAMTVLTPHRLVPRAFVVSAALLLLEWVLVPRFIRAGTVVFYLHTIVFGSVLTSGFWSMVNERFDPHTAKQIVGRIASGGTLGALIGGLSAERIGANLSLSVMFPFLAALHLFCAWVVRDLRGGAPRVVRTAARTDVESGLSVLTSSPYLRSMALLVGLGTAAAALLDYLLKAEATRVLQSGEDLVRFFAALYASTGLVSFVVQTTLSARTLERLGLGRTVALLPLFSGIGSLLTILAAPGIAPIALTRGMEAMLRTSLYRSAYELLYTPVAAEKKRATKSIIDVLCDRFGDVTGGALVAIVIAFATPEGARAWILVLAAALSFAGVVVGLGLQRGYVRTLAASLVEMGSGLAAPARAPQASDVGRVVQFTEMMLFDRQQGAFLSADPDTLLTGTGLTAELSPAHTIAVPASSMILAAADRADLLESGDPVRIRFALMQGKLTPELAPRAVRLLALNEVMVDAILALTKVVDREVERLVAALLDPDEDFAVRRRLPRVLAKASSSRASEGLTVGLFDPRFEVRFQCGRALAAIKEARPEVRFEKERVLAAVEREVAVDRSVWESHRLLDGVAPEEATDFADALLEDRASRSMQHVFTTLSLVVKKEPLEVAYRGLFTDDRTLRGTSLEYLATIIPDPIRERLWPFLDAVAPREARPRAEVLEDLMRSRGSIMLKLEELQAIRLKGKAGGSGA